MAYKPSSGSAIVANEWSTCFPWPISPVLAPQFGKMNGHGLLSDYKNCIYSQRLNKIGSDLI